MNNLQKVIAAFERGQSVLYEAEAIETWVKARRGRSKGVRVAPGCFMLEMSQPTPAPVDVLRSAMLAGARLMVPSLEPAVLLKVGDSPVPFANFLLPAMDYGRMAMPDGSAVVAAPGFAVDATVESFESVDPALARRFPVRVALGK